MDKYAIDHPLLGALFRYWNEKRGARVMPRRADIDPLEMGPALLPHLMLCDLFDRGLAIRFRLVGTAVVKYFGFDPTGRHLETGPAGSYFGCLGTLHRLVFAERAPVYSEGSFRWGLNRHLDIAQLLLPLAGTARDPAMALAALALRADTAPPALRFLDQHAIHIERRRAVLSAAPAGGDVERRNVA
jgi:hypothetical protein